ncbi:MAG: peptidoglycan DD-metalloendopeptidase family protein [Bacteroides sp.]|uniref:murein hydrolase activator EnvC family protein n=1 Tax=Bacteroides sp. TaxID=29523 RepID=UPI001B6D752B|nr:peptidoglycan DD-metalloendopeptidase family protein [Bacteroides sp.]MBP6066022.1 peptidoglycan DD-metalloendopeptidase family protein [Bacteroides sp.]MBP6068048.1 peptidoglycan DD-metalloendopeptidase family protein [Bacteroides sp.]MBP9506423.1 peptidoglycan DD-metalloendopeptidase family protein [Bacteroides sp.]
MMKHLFVLIICGLCLATPLSAQSNKLIKELENKRGTLQRQIAETESLLKNTKKDVGSQLNSLAVLTGQIEERKRYILAMNNDVELIDRELKSVEQQLGALRRDLREKKKKYESSVQYLYKNKSIEEKLMFIFSAKDLSQTYRRLRYVREYATYQRIQGEEIVKKQEQVTAKRNELKQVKAAKVTLLKDRESEKAKLEAQEKDKRTLVGNLQKMQKGLQQEISKKRREANQLNARIDKLIAEEIERARKRAEEEARQEARREAEARKKTEGGARPSAKETKGGKRDDSEAERASTGARKKAEPLESYSMSKADRELSSSFINNRGRLPMPISGAYIITSRYGEYAVEGLRNVKLDNKGIDIQGKPGAQARALFDGKVAAVFQLNGLFNILIRHGNYISVYCNLSSASVKSGDMVSTKQNIGQVFSDGSDNGRTVLHFQLRREKEKLNPEPWLNR